MVTVTDSAYAVTENEEDVERGVRRIAQRVLAIQAAPRGRRGATEQVFVPVVEGMRDAGAAVDLFHLAELRAEPCDGTFKCWIGPESECRLDDDLGPLITRIPGYDLVVLAMPLYTDLVPANVKNFIDRCMVLLHPSAVEHAGRLRHPSRHRRMPNLAVVAVCGMPGLENFRLLLEEAEAFGRHMHMPLVASIVRPETLSFYHPSCAGAFARFTDRLRLGGRQLVERGKVDPGLRESIAEPLLERDVYLQWANTWWRR